tara:strand:+ start:1610 stop:2389 length:780 start_codon:yes stop_codon:yes gene_type:complete
MDNLIKELLDPVDPKVFFKEYWGKKHLVLRRNKFKNLFNWNDFEQYMNEFPKVPNLQIIGWDDKHEKWCLDKVKKGKLKLPMLTKTQIHKAWKDGKSVVIPFAEYRKEVLMNVCKAFERYFAKGQVNVYASPGRGSKSFPAHADNTENFLFHTQGRVKWRMFKEFAPDKPKEILEEFILEAGDLLYIPQFQYHEVLPIGARILCSIHFPNKPKQSLKNFQISKNSKREPWYKWQPEKYDTNGHLNTEDFPYKWKDSRKW